MGRTKLVYEDNGSTKVLWGNITGEDSFFVNFRTVDNKIFRVNKRHIIAIKDSAGDFE